MRAATTISYAARRDIEKVRQIYEDLTRSSAVKRLIRRKQLAVRPVPAWQQRTRIFERDLIRIDELCHRTGQSLSAVATLNSNYELCG
jgi:hypothetical protein